MTALFHYQSCKKKPVLRGPEQRQRNRNPQHGLDRLKLSAISCRLLWSKYQRPFRDALLGSADSMPLIQL